MDIEEFEDLLDRHGEDLTRWPADKQRPALQLLAQSEEAKELLQESEELRNLIGRRPTTAPSGLSDRIVAQALAQGAQAQPQSRSWALSWWPQPRAFFLALCFAAGILAGVLSSKSVNDLPSVNMHDYVAYMLNFAYPVD